MQARKVTTDCDRLSQIVTHCRKLPRHDTTRRDAEISGRPWTRLITLVREPVGRSSPSLRPKLWPFEGRKRGERGSATTPDNPLLPLLSSTTADGSYKSGESINITATMNEAILAGSKMTVTLSTTDLVTLTAGQNGTTLSGTYTISAADTSSDLAISSYSLTDASGTTNSVIDAFGNAMSATTLPAGQNLSDNKALVVDNTALFTNATVNLGANPAAGDTFALTFNEAVKNTAAISTAIADNAAFGASSSKATTSWSADAKTATVTLGTGETFNADMTLTLASVLDLASNEATSVVYTLDIA